MADPLPPWHHDVGDVSDDDLDDGPDDGLLPREHMRITGAFPYFPMPTNPWTLPEALNIARFLAERGPIELLQHFENHYDATVDRLQVRREFVRWREMFHGMPTRRTTRSGTLIGPLAALPFTSRGEQPRACIICTGTHDMGSIVSYCPNNCRPLCRRCWNNPLFASRFMDQDDHRRCLRCQELIPFGYHDELFRPLTWYSELLRDPDQPPMDRLRRTARFVLRSLPRQANMPSVEYLVHYMWVMQDDVERRECMRSGNYRAAALPNCLLRAVHEYQMGMMMPVANQDGANLDENVLELQ